MLSSSAVSERAGLALGEGVGQAPGKGPPAG